MLGRTVNLGQVALIGAMASSESRNASASARERAHEARMEEKKRSVEAQYEAGMEEAGSVLTGAWIGLGTTVLATLGAALTAGASLLATEASKVTFLKEGGAVIQSLGSMATGASSIATASAADDIARARREGALIDLEADESAKRMEEAKTAIDDDRDRVRRYYEMAASVAEERRQAADALRA